MKDKNYIAQISDTHLFGDKQKKINGANSYSNLKQVINHIERLENKPALIVISGDLSQDCTFESYQHIANILNNTKIKYCLLPGNHDDVSVINKVFDFNWETDNMDYSFENSGWYFYVLDTSRYPKDGGELSSEQISKFKSAIEKNKNKPAIVFMHHHPVPINSPWMDNMILSDANKFNEIIVQNPQIKAVLFGHIHQVFEKKINGTFYGSAPSTSFQVLPNCEMFALQSLTPGYRFIELNGNEFSSKIIWVEK